MVISSIEGIWNAICDEVKTHIPQVSFDCFLKDLVPVSIEENEFVVRLDNNDYMRNLIEENYGELLEKSIYAIMGIPKKLKIMIKEDEEAILRAEEQSEGLTFQDFFTFDNFIVGSTNRFAQAVAFAVAETPGLQNYNPLVIYGNSGVGKTHLLLAIKNHIKKKYPNKKIEYSCGEEFTNQLIRSLQEGKLGMGTIDDFRARFRNADVLLLDDIHFIAGKEQTQEEFFNTFNALYQSNKQIVVTLDRPLKDIKSLDDRIRSRLSAGLFADITPPDFETRVGIILKKAEEANIKIEENLVYYIAENIKSNTRQLEGVVKKLQAYINLTGKKPNLSVVQGFIRDVISDMKPEPIKVEKIISEVAKTYNVSERDILSNRKTASLVLARQVAMYIARMATELSYKAIGESFGKDHTTVLHNVDKIEKFLADKPYEKSLVEDMIKNLKSNE